MLIALAVGALAGRGWQLDRAWMLLAFGIFAFCLADSLYLMSVADGSYTPGGWFDAGWWLGIYLVALAPWQPSERETGVTDERMRLIACPLGFGGVGLALLVYGCLVGVNLLAVGLAAAALLAVMARLSVTFRDNVAMLRTSREEALTDALTELGNRRALSRRLDAVVEGGEALTLVLFDLDGFHRHPLVGERIIAAAPALGGVAALVRSSHERFDGSGYPDRLAGDEIPLGARIVAVADAFDAMTSTGTYSAARTPREALEELRRCAGVQFDPAVVDAFAATWAVHGLHAAA